MVTLRSRKQKSKLSAITGIVELSMKQGTKITTCVTLLFHESSAHLKERPLIILQNS